MGIFARKPNRRTEPHLLRSATPKNHAIILWQVLFEFIIVIHHSIESPVGGALVEFFFFVSGCFLYRTFLKDRDKPVALYAANRVERLYPQYILAFVLLYLFVNRTNLFTWTPLVKALPEILMLQNIGLTLRGGLNYPLWYLSVLVTASPILFALLKYLRSEVFDCAAIFTIVTVYALLVYHGGLEQWEFHGAFYLPWWRGCADLLIGVEIAKAADFLSRGGFRRLKHIFRVCEILLSAVVVWLVSVEKADFYCAVAEALFLLCLLSPYSLYERISGCALVAFLGKYQFALYANQALAIEVIRTLARRLGPFPTYAGKYLLPLLTALLLGIFTQTIEDGIRYAVKRVKKAKKRRAAG